MKKQALTTASIAALLITAIAGAFFVDSAVTASEGQTENTWITMTSMPEAGGYAAAVVNGKIHVFGNSFNYEYDPATDSWALKTPMPKDGSGFAVTACEGKIYLMGGELNEVYDPVTDTWATKKPMPTPRDQMEANVVNGKIYVVGGRTGGPYSEVNVTEVYDPVTDSWTTKASIPYSTVRYASAVVGNKIYVIGGDDNFGWNLNQIYDTETDTWTFGAPIPVATRGASAGATTGVLAPKRIHVMGNDEGFFDPSSQHYIYDPQTDTWRAGASLPIACIDPAIAIVNDSVYVIGGWTGTELGWPDATAAVERYTPFLFGNEPAVSVLSPRNQTYASSDVPLTFTVGEPAVSLSYSLDGGDVTVIGNATLASLSTGVHTVRIYAWGKAGNVGASETVTFTVEPFPTALAAIVSGASTAAVIACIILYFRKRK